jgi:hypothetical protein
VPQDVLLVLTGLPANPVQMATLSTELLARRPVPTLVPLAMPITTVLLVSEATLYREPHAMLTPHVQALLHAPHVPIAMLYQLALVSNVLPATVSDANQQLLPAALFALTTTTWRLPTAAAWLVSRLASLARTPTLAPVVLMGTTWKHSTIRILGNAWLAVLPLSVKLAEAAPPSAPAVPPGTPKWPPNASPIPASASP